MTHLPAELERCPLCRIYTRVRAAEGQSREGAVLLYIAEMGLPPETNRPLDVIECLDCGELEVLDAEHYDEAAAAGTGVIGWLVGKNRATMHLFGSVTTESPDEDTCWS